eukprot:4824756-Prymnesium_polylepis.1
MFPKEPGCRQGCGVGGVCDPAFARGVVLIRCSGRCGSSPPPARFGRCTWIGLAQNSPHRPGQSPERSLLHWRLRGTLSRCGAA